MDITQREHIVTLVDAFYNKVKADDLLGPIFSHLDWSHHLPVMYNFWSSMLLGDQSYQGTPFPKHLGLAIDQTHFARWLSLFNETVGDLYVGEKADEAKMRAQSIAGVFQVKLGLMK